MFFTAALPRFVTPAGSVPVQITVLGAVLVLITLVLDSGWALIAGSARSWFATEPRRMVGTTRAGGAVMAGVVGVGIGPAVEAVRPGRLTPADPPKTRQSLAGGDERVRWTRVPGLHSGAAYSVAAGRRTRRCLLPPPPATPSTPTHDPIENWPTAGSQVVP